MTLSAGTRLGPYEILAKVGAGGMGEVYRAKDTRLERTVAIKVLPEAMSADPQLRLRFEREARLISQLSHPHICALYDIGREGEKDYLVMELLEGGTLANRLEKGPLSPGDTLRWGVQIADALDKAHRQGIVHRDLKPGNVMLTASGVKLLDFGLAKVFRTEPVTGLSVLPTSSHLTKEGAILGTIHYMSPEQLEGKEVDGRTDIFSLGALLYEMATGRKAFPGNSAASVIGAILRGDPAPIAPSETPSSPFDRVIRKCLAKDREKRWQSAHDVASELEWLGELGSGSMAGLPAPPLPASRPRRAIAAILGAALLGALVAAGAVALGLFRVGGGSAPAGRRVFPLVLSSGADCGSVAVSPDGRKVALTMNEFSDEGGILIRSVDAMETTLLAGTEGAADPFWSPDGRDIGFFSRGKIRRISVEGGAQQTLADADRYGGSWNAEGTILYCPAFGNPLMRVSSSGGAPQPVTTLDASRQEVLHCWPNFLPDGKHFLYFARSIDPGKGTIWVGSLESGTREMLTGADAGPVYVPPGDVLFAREGALLVQRFDPAKRKLVGDPIPLARKVSVDPSNNDLFASAGANLLVYQVHSPRNRELTWLDRTGRALAKVGPPAEFWTFALSPDETQIVASIADPDRRTGDLWIVDVARGTRVRLTSGPSDEFMPRWSSNGFIYYTADPEGYYDVYRTPASGTGSPEKVLHTTLDKWVNDVSRDGASLLIQVFDLKTVYDLWVLALGSTEKPEVTFAAGYPETEGQFSPDGRWIAYASRESGRDEVLVSPRSAPTRRLQISVGGGTQPRWSRDGREIFFLTPDRKLMAATVRLHEATAEVLDTKPLFSNKDFRLGWDPRVRTTYEVSVDGRFLFPLPVDERDARPIVAVVDWAASLERR